MASFLTYPLLFSFANYICIQQSKFVELSLLMGQYTFPLNNLYFFGQTNNLSCQIRKEKP